MLHIQWPRTSSIATCCYIPVQLPLQHKLFPPPPSIAPCCYPPKALSLPLQHKLFPSPTSITPCCYILRSLQHNINKRTCVGTWCWHSVLALGANTRAGIGAVIHAVTCPKYFSKVLSLVYHLNITKTSSQHHPSTPKASPEDHQHITKASLKHHQHIAKTSPTYS